MNSTSIPQNILSSWMLTSLIIVLCEAHLLKALALASQLGEEDTAETAGAGRGANLEAAMGIAEEDRRQHRDHVRIPDGWFFGSPLVDKLAARTVFKSWQSVILASFWKRGCR